MSFMFDYVFLLFRLLVMLDGLSLFAELLSYWCIVVGMTTYLGLVLLFCYVVGCCFASCLFSGKNYRDLDLQNDFPTLG